MHMAERNGTKMLSKIHIKSPSGHQMPDVSACGEGGY